MKRTFLRSTVLALAGVGLMAGSALATPILEESFEADTPIIGFETLYAYDLIGAFEVTGGEIDWVGDLWEASDGLHSIDMTGSQLGTIAAFDLNTEEGKTYEVSFDMAGNPDGDPDIKNMYATVNPPIQTHVFSFDASETTRTDMGWASYSFQFTATGEQTTLQFGDLSAVRGGSWFGATLDNIVVDIAPVPEPATMLLFGTGLVGLAGIARRKKAQK